MIFFIIYWFIGLALIFTQGDPERGSREEDSIYIFLLLFIVVAWPLYLIIRLLDRGKRLVGTIKKPTKTMGKIATEKQTS